MHRLIVLVAALAVCSLGTAAQQQPSFSTTTIRGGDAAAHRCHERGGIGVRSRLARHRERC